MFSLVLAVGIAIGLIVSQIISAQQAPLKTTRLQTMGLTGIEGKEAVILLVEMAPGAVSAKNYHHGDEFGYILEGSKILDVEGKLPATYKAGETYHVPPKQPHFSTNLSTTAPAKVLVFLVVDKGQPISVPVK